jgi:hypothetical protein
MRSAIIGAFFAHNPQRRREFVLASSRLTHRSWQSDTAALAVAECAAVAFNSQPDPALVLDRLRNLTSEHEWRSKLDAVEISLAANHTVSQFAASIGLSRGVTGYSLHVVPVAIFAWLRHPQNYRTALTEALSCGGDTDTVGAILGGIAGAALGRAGIPADWQHMLHSGRALSVLFNPSLTNSQPKPPQQLRSDPPLIFGRPSSRETFSSSASSSFMECAARFHRTDEIFHLSFHLFSSNRQPQPPPAQPLSSLDEKIAPFFHLF